MSPKIHVRPCIFARPSSISCLLWWWSHYASSLAWLFSIPQQQTRGKNQHTPQVWPKIHPTERTYLCYPFTENQIFKPKQSGAIALVLFLPCFPYSRKLGTLGIQSKDILVYPKYHLWHWSDMHSDKWHINFLASLIFLHLPILASGGLLQEPRPPGQGCFDGRSPSHDSADCFFLWLHTSSP